MKPNSLFPHKYKKIGWIILIPALLIAIPGFIMQYEPDFLTFRIPTIISDELFAETEYFKMVENNVFAELMGILIIVGSLLVAFSKVKDEDEMTSKIRLESLVWAVFLNYGILIVALIFISGFAFGWVMLFNIFTILLFFIIRFHWQISKFNTTLQDAE